MIQHTHNPHDVAREIAALTGISPAGNDAAALSVRNLGMYVAWRICGRASRAAIGRAYGREATTVLYAIRSVEGYIASDPLYADLVATIEERILDRLRATAARSQGVGIPAWDAQAASSARLARLVMLERDSTPLRGAVA